MKKRKISMAEAAMTQECTFIQPIDISDTITLEELYNYETLNNLMSDTKKFAEFVSALVPKYMKGDRK